MESTLGRRPAAFVKDVQAMRVSLRRSMFLGTVCVSLLACAGGCRSGGTGWTTPSWMNWNNWSTSTPSSTSLAQNKPGSGPAKPSTQVSPQATASVAAGTGAASGYPGSHTGTTNPRYTTTTSPPPATSPAFGAAPASAYQQASTTGQVQPTVGYQTGPYSMTSSAAPQNPYAQSSYGQSGYSASSSSWSAPAAQPSPPANSYGA